MNREQAWTHYFNTGDREPLVKAYWDSVGYLAWRYYPNEKEDFFQVGMIGLLKAIDKIDPKRVKSKDAWVWLNVKGMMFNQKPSPRSSQLLEVTEIRENTGTRKFSADEWHLSDAENRGKIHLADNRYADDFDMYLSGLSKRKAFVLTMIYKFGFPRTHIAKLFNVSSMRIGQIEKKALKELSSCLA